MLFLWFDTFPSLLLPGCCMSTAACMESAVPTGRKARLLPLSLADSSSCTLLPASNPGGNCCCCKAGLDSGMVWKSAMLLKSLRLSSESSSESDSRSCRLIGRHWRFKRSSPACPACSADAALCFCFVSGSSLRSAAASDCNSASMRKSASTCVCV